MLRSILGNMADWYFGENGQQIGPVDDDVIRQAIQQGRLTRQTLVWREGMAQWVPLAAVPELSGAASLYAPPANGGYGIPYGQVMLVPRTSGLAIASMICGIVSILFCQVIGALPAIICGHMAIGQISTSPLPMSGRGMAIAGLILGYLQFLLLLVFIVMLVVGVTFR